MNKTSRFYIKTGPRLFIFPSTPSSTIARPVELPIVFRPSFLPSHPTLEIPTIPSMSLVLMTYPCAKPMQAVCSQTFPNVFNS